MNNIKFAIVTDNSNEPSYYCKDDGYFRVDNHEDVTSTDLPFAAFWTYPALFDGYYINLKNPIYPDIQFDIIFAAIECDIKYLDVLRTLYPNAIIVGMYKEYWNNDSSVRNYVIENTDAYIQPYLTIDDIYRRLGCSEPKKSYVIPQPINHKLLREKYTTEKRDVIFNYQKKTSRRESTNNELILKQISESELGLGIVNYTGIRGLQPFIKGWSDCKYMLSTDEFIFGGVQSVQCAVLDTIMVGGNNDNHRVLFPELVGTNVDFLVSKIKQLKSDSEYRNKVQSYAYETCINTFSYDAVREQILNLYNDLTNGN
tara:strand:- start:58 stop:999 length:942 start_codon:yes stop_codon:yes gene_type:complete